MCSLALQWIAILHKNQIWLSSPALPPTGSQSSLTTVLHVSLHPRNVTAPLLKSEVHGYPIAWYIDLHGAEPDLAIACYSNDHPLCEFLCVLKAYEASQPMRCEMNKNDQTCISVLQKSFRGFMPTCTNWWVIWGIKIMLSQQESRCWRSHAMTLLWCQLLWPPCPD